MGMLIMKGSVDKEQFTKTRGIDAKHNKMSPKIKDYKVQEEGYNL